MAAREPGVPSEHEHAVKATQSLTDMIPTVYYDLIARVCPGAGFWIAFGLVSEDVQRVFKVESMTGTALVLLLVMSYLAGIVLSGFCIVWDALSYKGLCALKALRAPLGLDPLHGLTRQWQIVAEKMDALAKKAQDPGRIVTKALAEVTLCQNLLTGLAVLAAIGFHSDGVQFFNPTAYPGTFLLAALALLLAMLFRQAMFLGRTHALYQMYVHPNDA